MSQSHRRGYENFTGVVDEFVSNSTPAWPAERRAPRGAPNVVVMLIDDMGFSDLGPFGSEIPTPNIDALASSGWTFTNYRTAPMCSPARAALMTGINPHRAGFGFVAHTDPGYPGFSCELPRNAPTLAESLRAGGYATFIVGKWHLTLESQLHDGADKSSWPLQRGFDRYFGCMDGFTSLHHPHRLVRDNSVVNIEEFPDDYFLTDDLVSESINMIEDLRASDETKPFFLYFAHTAVHGPLQAKEEKITNFKGMYQDGWNALREERFARQKVMGIIPEDAVLPEGDLADDSLIPPWETLDQEQKELFARHMEVYAAAVQDIDDSVGEIVGKLRELGELDNTIFIVTSDNGGTAEGGPTGTRSYFSQFGIGTTLPEDWVSDVPRPVEDIGGPKNFALYPTGWARVSNTPFRSFKSSTYEGGVHAPLVISWPNAPSDNQGLRDQFVFVSDLAPTILELTGVPPLETIGGKPALEIDGKSITDILSSSTAPGRSRQYFECVGRRALIDGQWKVVSPMPPTKSEGAAGGVWELYNLGEDPTESKDLAAKDPQKTNDLAQKWRDEAWANTVFPLNDDGTLHDSRPSSEKRLSTPTVIRVFRPPLERFRSAKLTVLKSFEIEISLEITSKSSGTVVAHGDQGGGYILAFEDARPNFSYNAYGEMHRFTLNSVKPGTHSMVLKFDEVQGLKWQVSLFVDGKEALKTPPLPMLLGMAPFTGISVGYDYGSPVDWDWYEKYRSFKFSDGTIREVKYVPGATSKHDSTVIREITEASAALAD